MKKSLLIVLALTALGIVVFSLHNWKDATSASPDSSPEIKNSQKLVPNFDPELEKLNKAGNAAYKCNDYAAAVKFFREAAEKGYAPSQNNLATCYADGIGLDKDPAQAVYWHRQAAEQGFAEAQYDLGKCYDNGEGVAEDPTQAFNWYRQAAEQGLAAAQVNLGYCYAAGKGVAEDKAQAEYWFRKAAEQGNAYAQLLLGCIYCSDDKRSEADFAEGKNLLQKAAAQQDEDGQNATSTAKDILKELEEVETSIAEAEKCKQMLQARNIDNAPEEKEKVLNNIDEFIASLSQDLHNIPGLITGTKALNEEDINRLYECRQRRQIINDSINTLLQAMNPS